MSENNLEKEFEAYVKLVNGISELEEQMVTVNDINAGILAITRGADLLKKASELLSKTKDIEVKEIIAELRLNLVETKTLLIDTRQELNNSAEEIQALKETIKKLEEEKAGVKEFKLKNGMLYKENDETAYCQVCYQDGKEISLTDLGAPWGTKNYLCPKCKSKFKGETVDN